MGDLCDSYEPYLLCVQEINRDLVTATAAISALTTFCMGVFANMPIGLAPGMGLNAYFTYTVVGYHGSGASRPTPLSALVLLVRLLPRPQAFQWLVVVVQSPFAESHTNCFFRHGSV